MGLGGLENENIRSFVRSFESFRLTLLTVESVGEFVLVNADV
jgi:hypothetical protein